MKGTEKQIAWAEDIKAATAEAIMALIADGENCAANPKYAAMKGQIEAKIATLNAQLSALNACDTACDIIDCFSGISLRDPLPARIKAFAAACRVRLANNNTQRKLLAQ